MVLGIPYWGDNGNEAKLRLAVSAIVDGCASAVKMVSRNTGGFRLSLRANLPERAPLRLSRNI
jgi:hypothetical protein